MMAKGTHSNNSCFIRVFFWQAGHKNPPTVCEKERERVKWYWDAATENATTSWST